MTTPTLAPAEWTTPNMLSRQTPWVILASFPLPCVPLSSSPPQPPPASTTTTITITCCFVVLHFCCLHVEHNCKTARYLPAYYLSWLGTLTKTTPQCTTFHCITYLAPVLFACLLSFLSARYLGIPTVKTSTKAHFAPHCLLLACVLLLLLKTPAHNTTHTAHATAATAATPQHTAQISARLRLCFASL